MMKNPLLLLAILLAAGCISTASPSNSTAAAGSGVALETVQAGDTVSVNYIGKLENGTIFDTSYAEVAKNAGIFSAQRPYEPLNFTAGAGQMIPGFDKGVLGMKKGEQKVLTILPEDAYGEILPQESVPLSILEENNITAVAGADIFSQDELGRIMRGKITEVNETHAAIDFNHPLAGKTLIFNVTVENIVKPKAQ